MKYQKFKNKLCELVKAGLPADLQPAEVEAVMKQKNNHTEFESVRIHSKSKHLVTHTNLNKCYEDYENGFSMAGIAGRIIKDYIHLLGKGMDGMPFDFKDYNLSKEHLMVQLINRDMNREMLEQTPHNDLPGTNLSAVCKVIVDQDATFLVTNKILEYWNLTAEALYQEALDNTIKIAPLQLITIEEAALLKGMDISTERGIDIKMEPHEMYVLRNSLGAWGAAAILYPEVLSQLANTCDSNLYILPSSIHDVILVMETSGIDVELLQSMVISANLEALPAEDILSNDIYYYDKDENVLSMATSREKTAELLQKYQREYGRYIAPEAEDALER